MKIQEMRDLCSLISEKIAEDPEIAFDFFKKNWEKLTLDEKKLFVKCRENPQLVTIDPRNIKHSFTQEEMDKSNLAAICRSLITDYIYQELNGQQVFAHLKCGETIKPVDIACVFKLLKDHKYIDNTLPEIEQVIRQVFNLKKNTTIGSYLNDPEKLRTATIKFKKLINTLPRAKS